MKVKANTSARKGLSNWKAPLDVKQPNGNTHSTGGKGCLSTNKKSVPFHIGEWPFSVGAVFIFISVSFLFLGSVRTIALIQGGFFSTAPQRDSRQDNGAKSVTKTCNHIDSCLACPFCHLDTSQLNHMLLIVSVFLDNPSFLLEVSF